MLAGHVENVKHVGVPPRNLEIHRIQNLLEIDLDSTYLMILGVLDIWPFPRLQIIHWDQDSSNIIPNGNQTWQWKFPHLYRWILHDS